MSEAFERGIESGVKAASKATTIIRLAKDQKTLAILSGNALETHKKSMNSDEKWYSRNPDYYQGFWEGWMTRSDEIRSL